MQREAVVGFSSRVSEQAVAKMLSVCLDVNQGDTNHNHCTQRLISLGFAEHTPTNEPRNQQVLS